jgi:hypothetical protein
MTTGRATKMRSFAWADRIRRSPESDLSMAPSTMSVITLDGLARQHVLACSFALQWKSHN